MPAARVGQILAGIMAENARGTPIPDALVDACSASLAITGAGLAWMTENGPGGPFAATDGPARIMEELQFELGEGPCVDCSEQGRPVLQSDLGRTGAARWPAFTASALDAGIRAIFAFPLQVGGIRLGVLDLYRDVAGPLEDAELTDALSFADAATAILLHLQTDASPDAAHPHITEPMDDYAEVHQATGMTAAQLEIPLAEALALLRARAFAAERPILAVARDIVERRLRLER